MVKRVFGKVDGIEVNYDHSKGDWWNVPVPLDIDGEYVIEVIAEDEAWEPKLYNKIIIYRKRRKHLRASVTTFLDTCLTKLKENYTLTKLKENYTLTGCTQNVRR